MSILGLLSLLFALIAALLLVLYALQRRELHSLWELSQQLQRIAIGGRLPARLDITSDKPEVAALVTAVNHLLTRSGPGVEHEAVQAPKLFAELGDRIHEARASSASTGSSSSGGAWRTWCRRNTPSSWATTSAGGSWASRRPSGTR
jgi:methyl-accepting chemotaxis protein